MKDKVEITFSDGRTKEVKIPDYGNIEITVRNGKVAMIDTKKSEKIC